MSPVIDDAELAQLSAETRAPLDEGDPAFGHVSERRVAQLERLGRERSARISTHLLGLARDPSNATCASWAAAWLATWGVVEIRPLLDELVEHADVNELFHALSLQARLTAWERTRRGCGVVMPTGALFAT